MISPDLKKNLEKNCQILKVRDFGDSDDDITRFTLVEIDNAEYEKFKIRLIEKLKEICAITSLI